MKYLLFYEAAEDAATKVPEHFAAHEAAWRPFLDSGELLMIGPYADGSGALAIFTSDEAARRFAEGDPFVVNGVVRRWHVQPWMEALTDS